MNALDSPPPIRILILSASVGAGHVRAAEALARAFAIADPSSHVRHVDVLSLTNAVFRRVYGRGYIDLVNRAPNVVGMMYDWTDATPDHDGMGSRVRVLIERLNLARLSRLVRSEPWDVIINTHFLPAELVARLIRRGQTTTPQMTVVTDIDAHAVWVHEPTARYFVASEDAASSLEYWGVTPSDIRLTGIPIDPAFAGVANAPRAPIAASLGFNGPDRPLVVLLAGGFGVGPIRETFERLLAIQTPARVLVVCGRNAKLQAAITKAAAGASIASGALSSRHEVVVTGFTTRMPEILRAADLVVSKPGGLTLSECLAAGVPMVIMNPIPGQETRNSDFLLEQGCAIKINSPASVARKIGTLLDDPRRLAAMRDRANELGKPAAGLAIADHVLQAVARARGAKQ